MYVNPFWAGVACTLWIITTIICAAFIHLLWRSIQIMKGEDKNGKN